MRLCCSSRAPIQFQTFHRKPYQIIKHCPAAQLHGHPRPDRKSPTNLSISPFMILTGGEGHRHLQLNAPSLSYYLLRRPPALTTLPRVSENSRQCIIRPMAFQPRAHAVVPPVNKLETLETLAAPKKEPGRTGLGRAITHIPHLPYPLEDTFILL